MVSGHRFGQRRPISLAIPLAIKQPSPRREAGSSFATQCRRRSFVLMSGCVACHSAAGGPEQSRGSCHDATTSDARGEKGTEIAASTTFRLDKLSHP